MAASVIVTSKRAVINYIMYLSRFIRTSMAANTAGATKKANNANLINLHLNPVE